MQEFNFIKEKLPSRLAKRKNGGGSFQASKSYLIIDSSEKMVDFKSYKVISEKAAKTTNFFNDRMLRILKAGINIYVSTPALYLRYGEKYGLEKAPWLKDEHFKDYQKWLKKQEAEASKVKKAEEDESLCMAEMLKNLESRVVSAENRALEAEKKLAEKDQQKEDETKKDK